MDKETARQRQARERKAQLLEEALTLFAAQGVEGTSVKDLAEATGVAPGLLYYYFKSKEDLVREVFAHYSFTPQMREIVGNSEGIPVRVVLETVSKRFCKTLESRASLVRVLMREALVNPMVSAELKTTIDGGLQTLVDFLETRMTTNELRPHNAAVTARALIFPLLLRHVLFDDNNETFTNDLVDTLMQGIAAPNANGAQQ